MNSFDTLREQPPERRSLLKNFSANLVGQFLYPILQLLLVPFYISRLGLEGYGLIGFFSMLITILGVFTKGLAASLQREVARRDVAAEERRTLGSLVRTFEFFYWGVGSLLGVVLLALAGFIIRHWLRVASVGRGALLACIASIAVTVALAFPGSVYQAVYNGLQRQVLGNAINAFLAFFAALLGAAAILLFHTVASFYLASVVSTLLSILVHHFCTHRILMGLGASAGVFDRGELKRMWGFTGGVIWTNGIGVLVTQLDRLVISKLMPVSSLGVYTAGMGGGRLLGMMANPFLAATYPQLCQVAKAGSREKLLSNLLRDSKVVLLLCLAVGLPVSFFAADVLQVWTGNETVVRLGSPIMALYLVGNVFISVSGVAYMLQLAMGIVRFGIFFNTAALVWYPLALLLLVKRLGLLGAAWSWVLYGAASFLYHFLLTSWRILGWKGAGRYGLLFLTGSAPALILAYGARRLALLAFPHSALARLGLAILSGLAILGVGYLISFGPRVPSELEPIFSRIRRSLSSRGAS